MFAVLAYATPVFFLGLLFKLLFAVKLGWLPTSRQASGNVDAILSNGRQISTGVVPQHWLSCAQCTTLLLVSKSFKFWRVGPIVPVVSNEAT